MNASRVRDRQGPLIAAGARKKNKLNTLVVHGMRYYTDLPGYGMGKRSTVFLYAFDLIELKGDDLRRDPPGAPSLRVSRLGSRAGNEFRCGP
jgi:hypothetical protein